MEANGNEEVKCPMEETNYDYIKKLSPKEMAHYLCEFVFKNADTCYYCVGEKYCEPGHNGMEEWLQRTCGEEK